MWLQFATSPFLKLMNRYRKLEIIAGAVSLFIGCSMYLLFRNTSINLYRWVSSTFLGDPVNAMREAVSSWNLPFFVEYSLPDGLYCISYILIMDALWHDSKSWARHLIVLSIPLAAILHELAQGMGIAKGSFDLGDLACYVIPVIIYVIVKRKK